MAHHARNVLAPTYASHALACSHLHTLTHPHAHTRARIYARPLVHARSHLRMTCDACTHVACTCSHIRVRSCARPLIRVAITGLPSKTREVFQILQGWPGAFCERKRRLGAQTFSRMRVWMPNIAWLLRPVLEASGDVLGYRVTLRCKSTSNRERPRNVCARPVECVTFHPCMWAPN